MAIRSGSKQQLNIGVWQSHHWHQAHQDLQCEAFSFREDRSIWGHPSLGLSTLLSWSLICRLSLSSWAGSSAVFKISLAGFISSTGNSMRMTFSGLLHRIWAICLLRLLLTRKSDLIFMILSEVESRYLQKSVMASNPRPRNKWHHRSDTNTTRAFTGAGPELTQASCTTGA